MHPRSMAAASSVPTRAATAGPSRILSPQGLGAWLAQAGLALLLVMQTTGAQAATILAPDPFDGVAGTFALRFDIAGATPPGEVISEARFTATFRALPTPPPAPLLDVTVIPRRVVNAVPTGDGVTTTYRTETVQRVGARPANVAFAVGDPQEADRQGRLRRIELATTPVTTIDTRTSSNIYNVVNDGVDLDNCEEDDPHWTQFLIKGPPDDCYAVRIDLDETVLTTITETPNTIGVLIDFALTEPEIALAALNGFIEVSFKGNGRGEIYDPELAFKTVARAIDPDDDDGDGPVPVPLPPTAALLSAALALLALRRGTAT
jgi:hypothetical protein